MGSCPAKSFESASKVCQHCIEGCQSCSNDSWCETCVPGLLEEQLGPAKLCVNPCSDGWFETTGLCELCHSSCLTCNESEDDNCLSCPVDKFPKKDDVNETEFECVDVCPSGYSLENGTCLPCHGSCEECYLPGNFNQCLTCRSGDFYYPLNFNIPTGRCLTTCEGTAQSRTVGSRCACPEDTPIFNKLLGEHKCEAECSKGFHNTNHDICGICADNNCDKCSSAQAGNCEVCEDFFYIYNSLCLACDVSCLKCEGPGNSECTQCEPAKKLT